MFFGDFLLQKKIIDEGQLAQVLLWQIESHQQLFSLISVENNLKDFVGAVIKEKQDPLDYAEQRGIINYQQHVQFAYEIKASAPSIGELLVAKCGINAVDIIQSFEEFSQLKKGPIASHGGEVDLESHSNDEDDFFSSDTEIQRGQIAGEELVNSAALADLEALGLGESVQDRKDEVPENLDSRQVYFRSFSALSGKAMIHGCHSFHQFLRMILKNLVDEQGFRPFYMQDESFFSQVQKVCAQIMGDLEKQDWKWEEVEKKYALTLKEFLQQYKRFYIAKFGGFP